MSKKEMFHFTVGQLIEVLKSLPQDLPVLTRLRRMVMKKRLRWL